MIKWRTVRDSNSRYPYEYASLAGMWFQPTHPTVQVDLFHVLWSEIIEEKSLIFY